MKRFLIFGAGVFALYLSFYGLTTPYKKSVAVIAPPSPVITPTPEPSETPTSPENPPEPVETIESPTPTPNPVVEPYNPTVADIAQEVVNEYYSTDASVANHPSGFGGWHLRQDPCISDACLFDSRPLLPTGYRLKVLDYAGLPDNLGNTWIKVRVFYTNGELVGYIHSTGIRYD